MGPPKDVSPSELFLKLLEPQPSEVVDFPRYDENGKAVGRLRLQVLPQDDIDRARIAAQNGLKAKNLSHEDMRGEAVREVLADATARELLATACLTESGPEDDAGKPMYGRVFRDAADLGKLRPTEIAVLFNAYMLVQSKFGPHEKTVLDEGAVNAWIKRLEEGGSEFPLLRLPLPDLVRLASLLAGRAYLLSSILDSLWSSLPDTLKSDLEGFSMGTGFYGKRAENSTPISGESSADEPVTTDAAIRMTEALKSE